MKQSGRGNGVAAGGAAGWRAAGQKAAGKEFSHWVPKRLGGPNSKWNGNYVSTKHHALSDPYRYKFAPKAWKQANPIWPAWKRQAARVPYWMSRSAAGGASTGTSAYFQGE